MEHRTWARNTSAAFSALATVLAALTIVGCSPGGSTPADPQGNTQATSAGRSDPAATQASNGGIRPRGKSAGDATTDHIVQFAREAGAEAPPPEVTPGELLVKFKAGTPSSRMRAASPRSLATSVSTFTLVPGLQHVKLAPGVGLDTALEEYRARPDVEYAEPNYVVRISALPNDPRFVEQWGLDNTGQTGGVLNADIDGPEAWNLTQGDSSVVVAVIDSGVDYTHPDLAANIYRNTSECNANGLDDDGNGYVDDCNGIDTLNGDSDPADDNQHGTHVAGIIGAVGNNGVGIAGVAWNVKILPCKFIGADGSGTTADAIACLDYIAALAARGVNIIATNNSWGGGGASQALADAIATQRQHGILFITAAGNSLANHDYYRTYPCDYDAPNIVCVAAITESNALAIFSDYGWHSVHVGAPGLKILSTLPGGLYGELDGTSMATPHVTGIAALLKAHNATRNWRAIRNLILAGGKPRAALLNKTITTRAVSALGSLTCSNSIVRERLRPVLTEPMRRVGDPVVLRMLHINCANPNGAPTVSISPSGETVLLHDDGLSGDTVANDGIYSATWTSYDAGTYTLSFAGVSASTVTFDEHLRPGFPLKTLTIGGLDFQGGPAIHTLVGNIDADPELEILRSALSLGLLNAWNHDGTRANGWPPGPQPGGFYDVLGVAYPVLGRFTGSTHLDVFANYTGQRKAAHSGSGQLLPGWPQSTSSQFPGSAADLDGDGIDEIIVEDNDNVSRGFIQIRRPDGTHFPGWPITLPASSTFSTARTPALADLFGDGELEIITADIARVYAYHRDGRVVAGFPVDLSATTVRSYPVVGDVDGDGAPEIVVLSQAQDATHAAIICILSNTGVIERTIVTPFEIARDVAPALADLDGDGIPEIVVQFDRLSSAGAVGVWRGTGTQLPGWPVPIDDNSGHSAPVVGDVDGDGAPDVVLMTHLRSTPWLSDVRVYNRLGQPLAGFPKFLPSGDGAVPAVADLDLDGRNEVIVSGSYWAGYDGQYDTVWAFDLDGPAGNAAVEWGQFMNDEKHSGFYKTGKNLAASAYLATQIRGTGSITSSTPGIACGADCIELYPKGTMVTLTASGGTFGSWRGACAGQRNPCVVSIQDYTTVLAQFGASTLSVNVSGGGTVTSAPAGITCPNACSGSFGVGSVVTLTAIPQADAYFSEWSGACSGQALSCSVTMDAAKSVTASFAPKPVLSVSTDGTGSGTISSNPPGISCGSDCSEAYDVGILITLTATPAPGSSFDGWSNACSGTATTCTVTMNAARYVSATFTKQIVREINVTKMGTGTGSVVSDVPGLVCGNDCSESYAQDTTIVMTAVPAAGSAFVSWSGTCSGNAPTCTVLVNGPKTVTAIFEQMPSPTPSTFALNVSKSGSGEGLVTSFPAGIDCGGDCSESYTQDAVVTLTASASPSSVFSGWSGACSGTAATCSVTMSAAKSVSASFLLKPVLTVTLSGNGAGTVTSGEGGVACGNDCTESYAPSAVITLNVAAAQGSVFDGWSGACSGQNTSCTVTMDANKSIGASFRVASPPPSGDGGSSGGGKGGGGGLDWTALALCATALLRRQWFMRRNTSGRKIARPSVRSSWE